MSTPPWWDHLAEGVVLIEGERVTALNAAAGRMLRVDPAWAAGQDLFHVLRNNRLEAVWRDGNEAELTLGDRSLKARKIVGGLLLEDVSGERRAAETAKGFSHTTCRPASSAATVRSWCVLCGVAT